MKQLDVQRYSRKELAVLYKCSVKTIDKWLDHISRELGPRVGHFYSPRQVRIIFDRYGRPSE